ncbi:MAG: hypothetical protein ABJB74_04740 [Gemmatimonas sp.]
MLSRRALVWAALLVPLFVACADVRLAPSVPATLEFANFAAPAIVVGDSLRDVDGVAVPVHAVVRNQDGDVLADAPVRFVYADANRDTAVFVDSVTGYVVSLKALIGTAITVRIAARTGKSLQAIRTVLITTRPDTVISGSTPIDTLRTTLPDTGSAAAQANTSGALSVTLRHTDGTASTLVSNYLVKFELVQPANPMNDSTAAVFLVNDARMVSNIDTTDVSGIASRFVRVRSSQFPTGTALDSAVVRATVSYKGQSVKGSPILLVVPIIKKVTTP